MATIRQEKVSNLIKQELSMIFQQESRNWFGGAFISVTTVRVSTDLGVCKVYLSFFQAKDRVALLDLIKDEGWRVRKMLASKIGKQVRVIPALQFFVDDSLDYADEIDRLLKK
jgi:ribosome-binding factor A